MLRMVDLIFKKRNAEPLFREEIDYLVKGFTAGSIPDYQMAAFLMAVYFQGMTDEETGFLTEAMILSGETFDLTSISGPIVDKHSTGGVGDKVSLVLAPLVASCGIKVPMMSGRSLGHTGGTLDKLESIEGYSTDLGIEQVLEGLERVGYVMFGQSDTTVPADKKMYALRDVTGTVQSIALITASILAKKIAEGSKTLVFDVKCGSGAFMKEIHQARLLARSLMNTARKLGKKACVIISDMDQPLGRKIGNFLELREAVECLRGHGPSDLMDLTLRIAGWMLVLGNVQHTVTEAEETCRAKLEDGSAWAVFLKNVEFQGGDVRLLTDLSLGPKARREIAIRAPKNGYVQRIDAFALGTAATILGAGRLKQTDKVLPAVGIELLYTQGDYVSKNEKLCIVHSDDDRNIEEAMTIIEKAYTYSSSKQNVRSRIIEEIIS